MNATSFEVVTQDIPDHNITAAEVKKRLYRQFKDKVSIAMAMGVVLGKPVMGTKYLVTPKVSGSLF